MNGVKVAALSVLLVLLMGCQAEESASKVQPRTAAAVLEALKQDLRDRDTGRYEVNMFVDDVSYASETGEYSLSEAVFAAERTYYPPDEDSMTMVFRGIEDNVYMQMPGWRGTSKGCWMGFSRDEIAELTGTAPMSLGQGPASVALVLAAEDAEFADEHKDGVQVSVPAYLGLQAFQISGRVAADLPDLTDARVPAAVEVGAGRVVSVRLDGREVARALFKVGMGRRSGLGQALPSMTADIGYGSAGEITVVPPDPGLVVRAQPGMDRGCH